MLAGDVSWSCRVGMGNAGGEGESVVGWLGERSW